MNSYVKVRIEGKNVNNYLKWLIKNKVNIIKINIIKHNILEITIDYKYYKLLSKYSKTYKIKIVKEYGKINILNKIKNNTNIIIGVLLSVILLYLLSNIIFSIDIIYNDNEIKELLYKELSKYNIKKYRIKKDYNYLNKVKEKILKDNKDILEWIEIEQSGTKYIIKLVERVKEEKKEDYKFRSIVAKKNATITSIKAISGEKVKEVNQYVRKGEVIISGILTKPNEEKIYTKAIGKVYGEVWYKVNVEYPFYYKQEKLTGKSKFAISINFLNIKKTLFPYKKYRQFRVSSNTLIENNLIPISILKEKIYELNIEEKIYTKEEVIEKAIASSKKKLLEKNSNIININKVHVLEKQNLNSKIKLKLFISANEDITDILEIIEEEKQ